MCDLQLLSLPRFLEQQRLPHRRTELLTKSSWAVTARVKYDRVSATLFVQDVTQRASRQLNCTAQYSLAPANGTRIMVKQDTDVVGEPQARQRAELELRKVTSGWAKAIEERETAKVILDTATASPSATGASPERLTCAQPLSRGCASRSRRSHSGVTIRSKSWRRPCRRSWRGWRVRLKFLSWFRANPSSKPRLSWSLATAQGVRWATILLDTGRHTAASVRRAVNG